MPIRPGIRRLFRLADNRARDAKRQVDDEIRLHVELRAAQLMRDGYDAHTARAEAERLFAQSAQSVNDLYTTAQERNRDMKRIERFESWMQDIRYAIRGLARDRALAGFVVLTLALGIGANVTSFSLVDRLLVRGPAHVVHADRLVRLYLRTNNPPAGEQTSAWIPYATYESLRNGMKTFDELGAYGVRPTVVGRGDDARKLRVGIATGEFLHLLGVAPIRGRLFATGEDAAATGHVAIISEDLWRSRFGGDAGIIGRSLVVGGVTHTIVGVTPSGFSGADVKRVDVWTIYDSRKAKNINWRPVGRLRDGATLQTAGSEAQIVHKQTAEQGPKSAQSASVVAAPVHYGETAEAPPEAMMARWLAIVTIMILLITFANVVNLMLVRLTRRQRELGIRVALGSGRGRVIRLLAIEGAILAIAAGIASIGVARFVEPMVSQALLSGEAGWSFTLDGRLIGMILLFVAFTAVVVGVIPAVRAGHPNILRSLKTDARGGGSHARTRNALTVVQAAFSVVLLIGATLFVQSLLAARAVDLGVDPGSVIVASADLPPLTDFSREGFNRYFAQEAQSFERMVTRVRAMPGVEHAAISIGLPLDGGSFSQSVFTNGVDSVPTLPGGGPYASVVGTDYFATIGTRIVRGRAFDERDRAGAPRVIIVGSAMARTLWPDAEPIGQCVRLAKPDAECATVVGVAADVHRVGLEEQPSMQFYLALGQPSSFGGASLIVRPRQNDALTWPALRATMLAAEPAVTAVEISRLSDALNGDIRPLRLGLVTFGLSGALALLVAALGLYSLMAYTVAWRTREIGVRLALGASTSSITRLVVGDGTRLASLGIAIGVLFALIGGHWLQPQLFKVNAKDPVALIAVSVALLLVAAIAGWVPARKATRISPTEALRSE